MSEQSDEYGALASVSMARKMACGNVRYDASGIIEKVDGFVRRVDFEPGYDCWTVPCSSGHGRHGMQIRFVLTAEEGAVQFLMYTDWTPGSVDEIGHQNPRSVSYGAMAADLGHHWTRPVYEGEAGGGACDYLHGAPCFYDGSGLNAGPVMARFFTEGLDAVWIELEEYHRSCSRSASAVARGAAHSEDSRSPE